MRNKDALIRDINDGIVAVGAAKKELQLRSVELVAKMKDDGHDRQWGVEYMNLVCKSFDSETARWAMHYFNEAWPEGEARGDERLAHDAPEGA